MAVLTRQIFDKFEISDATLLESEQRKKLGSGLAGQYKEAIEIYKMEYERCVQRYNDLYNAAWRNFSYMAILAGGILSFGGTRFVTPLTACLACLPLLVCWWAEFDALKRYGAKVQDQILTLQ